jgi:hypothetical protein
MAKRRFFFLQLLGGLLCLTVIGCGPGRGDLSGKITYQGKSLRSGSISVLDSEGVPKSGLIQDDGSYLVQDIGAGPIKIAVISPDPGQSQPRPRKKDVPPPKVDRTGWFAIPEKYSDFDKSELSFDLRSGPNAWNIDLK